MMQGTPNFDEARAFLKVIEPNGAFSFQTFGDRAKHRKDLCRIRHGDFETHCDELARLNVRGAGVFVMVNEGDGKGRKSSNVQRVRAVFVDLDGAPIEPVLAASLEPHAVIESSPGKFHAYWRVDGLELTDFPTVQVALAYRFRGDPSVKDLPRVMRLPGFWHTKSDPFRSRFLRHSTEGCYEANRLLDALGIDPGKARAPFVGDDILPGHRNIALYAAGVGLQRKGFPVASIRTRLDALNRSRCHPPLPDAEVRAISAQASKYRVAGDPLSQLLSISQLSTVSPKARWVYVIACCRSRMTEGPFSLTVRDLEAHGIGRRQRADALKELQDAGLLECVREHRGGIAGSNRLCALFRLGAK